MNTMWLKKKNSETLHFLQPECCVGFLMCSKHLRARSRYFTEHSAGLCSRKDDFYEAQPAGAQEGKIQVVLLLPSGNLLHSY
jgi:hypothetical protein